MKASKSTLTHAYSNREVRGFLVSEMKLKQEGKNKDGMDKINKYMKVEKPTHTS